MKKISKTFIYLFGFWALLSVTTLVINLPIFDEELLQEVRAIKNIQAELYDSSNSYPALIAMSAPPGKTLKVASTEVRGFLNKKIKTKGIDYLDEEEFNILLGKNHDKEWQKKLYSCTSRREKTCMQRTYEVFKGKTINDTRLIEQIDRYKQLISFNEFKEATQLSFDSPLISYRMLMDIKQVFLSYALARQSSDQYLSAALKDLQFWRMVLKKGRLLITNMVAIASLSDDVQSVSLAIKQKRLSLFQLKNLQAQVKPLSQIETDLGQTFEFEFKYGMKAFDTDLTRDTLPLFEALLYQPNATHNTRYLHETRPLKKVATLSGFDFFKYVNSDQKKLDFVSPVSWSPAMLYNPTGKLLVSYAIPAYTDYISRVHDLNGMFYLLKLQIEIALNPRLSVEQVIVNSEYTNPYTLEPMSYNSSTHSIYFECMDKTSVCELDL